MTAIPEAPPLVSIVTVSNRPELVNEAIECVRRQRYPRIEFIAVSHRCETTASLFADQNRSLQIERCGVLLSSEETVGACRNLGCARAVGDIIAMFDDDDWYGVNYLSEGVNLLLDVGADFVGRLSYIWLDYSLGAFAYVRAPGAFTSAMEHFSGNTHLFRRKCFGSLCQYARSSLGEDFAFSTSLHSAGGLLVSGSRRGFVRRRNLSAGHRHLWNGIAPGFRLTEHEPLPFDEALVRELAHIDRDPWRP